MYIPKLFNETDVMEMHAFIHQNPFAVLVTLAADGLVANHIPLVLDVAENRLRGHVARANPIWQDLAQSEEIWHDMLHSNNQGMNRLGSTLKHQWDHDKAFDRYTLRQTAAAINATLA